MEAQTIPFKGFIGASNGFADTSVDSERALNLFPEVNADRGTDAKAELVLRRRGGYALLQTLPESPCRGIFSLNGRCFAVANQTLYELTSTSTYTVLGTLAQPGNAPVKFVANASQIMFIADGLGYVLTLSSNVLTQVTNQNGFPTYATAITSVDLYGIVLGQNTTQFSISNPNDFTQWSGLNFSSDQEPDNVVSITECGGYLWILGQNEVVLYQNVGGVYQIFSRLPGSIIKKGCAAVNSPAVADNTVFWLGQDPNGSGMFYRASGVTPQRISTHAVETAIQGYSTIADCFATVMQDKGHEFVMWHFPTAGWVWVYDTATAMWHERGYWNAQFAQWQEDLARYHAFCFGVHLIADFNSGNIHQYSMANATDNSAPIRWIRVSPHISSALQWIYYFALILDMSVGTGILTGSQAGTQPSINLRFSDDGGNTWSNMRTVQAGTTGQYSKRLRFNRLGRSRNRVFEVSGSDPLPFLTLIGAWLMVKKGSN